MAITSFHNPDCTVTGFIDGEVIVYTMTDTHQQTAEVIKPIEPSYPKARKNKRRNFLKHK